MARNPAVARRIDAARLAVAEQLVFIERNGSNEAGYVRRYGDSSAPPAEVPGDGGRYGDGGQAIYAADVAELAKRHAELDALIGRR